MSSRASDARGFSLIEVLASIAIMSIVISGLTSTTINTMKANQTSRDTMSASTLAQDKVEEFRSLDPTTALAQFIGGSDQVDATGSTAGGVNRRFNRAWAVTKNSPATGLAEVVVTVSWTQATITRSISASTYVCLSSTC